MARYGMTLLAVGLVFGISQARADEKADKDKFQGEWSLVTLEENGQSQKITEESDHYIKLKIESDKFMITLKNGDHEATYALDSTKKPKTIDLTLKGGDQDGKVMKGFFELEGDILKICMGTPEAPARPAEFKSKDEVKVFTFKRVKR
jgi:uncharacterized protein (TIGR03067 family)